MWIFQFIPLREFSDGIAQPQASLQPTSLRVLNGGEHEVLGVGGRVSVGRLGTEGGVRGGGGSMSFYL